MSEHSSLSSYRLRDTDPTVVLDINDGKYLRDDEVVNFDYEAFRREARKKRRDGKDDNSDLGIHHDLSSENQYYPYDHIIDLGGNITNERMINRALRHELQHHIDFTENPSASKPSRAQKIGNKIAQRSLLVASGAIMAFPGAAATSKVMLDHAPIHEVAHNSIILSTLGAIAILGAKSFYRRNKYERRARKAERQRLTSIITVSKK